MERGLTARGRPTSDGSIARLGELLASGAVVPSIGGRFPLERTADALKAMADGTARMGSLEDLDRDLPTG